MKLKTILGWSSALCLSASIAQAQETNLEKQLQEMRESFAKQQRELQENFDRKFAAQAAEIESLKKQLGGLPPAPMLGQNSSAVPASVEQGSFVPTQTALEPKPWSPADPIRVSKGSAYLDLGLVSTFAVGGSTANDVGSLELGGHDPNQNGFTVQGVELNLQGAVDPYFRGNVNVLFSLDSEGESFMELEEAWLESVSLPYNLQVRAGQYFTTFGRINTQHPHSWGFVDVPIVSARLLGPDGLRNPGAQLSWLAPTPFYSELFFGVQNSQGETAYSFRDEHEDEPFFDRINSSRDVDGLADMLYSVRYAVSFDLTENQTLLSGVSAVFGPNSSGSDTCTEIYGTDIYWKWKSPHAHGGFPFVSWQTEALLRRYQAGAFSWDLNGDSILDAGEQDGNKDGVPDVLTSETVTDWGAYSQLLWGFTPGWVAGLRGDFATGDEANYEKLYGTDLSRAERWRVSPNLTWYPSEYSKIRLQYNYDDRKDVGIDHSVWLQFEFLLGAHAAHKF